MTGPSPLVSCELVATGVGVTRVPQVATRDAWRTRSPPSHLTVSGSVAGPAAVVGSAVRVKVVLSPTASSLLPPPACPTLQPGSDPADTLRALTAFAVWLVTVTLTVEGWPGAAGTGSTSTVVPGVRAPALRRQVVAVMSAGSWTRAPGSRGLVRSTCCSEPVATARSWLVRALRST